MRGSGTLKQAMPYDSSRRKLAASPNFALCHAADGSPFVIGEVEPYPQYWLSERERMILALFGQKGGLRVDQAIAAMLALRPRLDPVRERQRLERAIRDMTTAGVLMDPAGELSRYGEAMAHDYLEHRPFPAAIVAHLTDVCAISTESRVLDLASGPGSLALALAERTPHVTIMELSRGFVATAAAEAERRGLVLDTINESCNRLAWHDGEHDLVTVSQALHWLDDIAVCKGVCRILAQNGSFVVVHAAMNVPDSHPLAWILGNRTPLGDKDQTPFARIAQSLFRRLALLFAALDAPDVERHDPQRAPAGRAPIRGAGITLYNQPRPMDQGFARGFLSDAHIATTGLSPKAVWDRIETECAAASLKQLQGSMDWAVLHFQRGASGFDGEAWSPSPPTVIAYP